MWIPISNEQVWLYFCSFCQDTSNCYVIHWHSKILWRAFSIIMFYICTCKTQKKKTFYRVYTVQTGVQDVWYIWKALLSIVAVLVYIYKHGFINVLWILLVIILSFDTGVSVMYCRWAGAQKNHIVQIKIKPQGLWVWIRGF